MRLLSLATAAAILFAGSAAAEPTVLKFATGFLAGSDTTENFIKPWLKRIEDASKGTLKIEFYPSGQLAQIGDTVDRVAAGIADMGWDNPQAYGARFGSINVSSQPGLFDDPEIAAVALWRAYERGAVLREIEKEKIKLLLIYATAPSTYFMKKAPKSPTDFSGMKLAMSSSIRASVTASAGGVPVALNPPQYYQSLEKGVIDGVMTALIAIVSTKVDVLLDYYLRGPFGGSATIMFINKDVYEKLPPEAKKAIDDNSYEFASQWSAQNTQDFEEDKWKNQIGANAKNKVVQLKGADLATWQPRFEKVVQEWIGGDAGRQATYDGFKKALKEVEAEGLKKLDIKK